MHPRRHALQRALGAGNLYVDPHLGAVECRAGDRFLLCTDGVVDGLWDRHLDELVRAPGAAEAKDPPAVRLVKAAVAESGRDNTTALVVEML